VEWAAQVVVGEQLARRLIAGQFPELAGCELALLGAGWDNTVWLADGRLVFRFPRRAVAVHSVERQLAVLPLLAPLLPLPTTTPAYAGRPGEGFPWPWLGAPFVPGREAAAGAIGDDARVRGAAPLARFLRALHTVDPGRLGVDGKLLPVDANARTDMADRVPIARDWLERLAGLTGWRPPPAVSALYAAAGNLPAPRMTSLVHGDLHLRHLLVDDQGLPCAVIDWDDIGLSDPAIDLPLMWAHVPPAGRAAFLDAYGRVRDDQLIRSRLQAVALCGALAVYGAEESLAALTREATAGIERALRDG
jgi:aminoglycoside phosphotransferase (APT) family kinase protein